MRLATVSAAAPAALEGPGGFFPDLAGAEQQDARVGEAAEDREGKLDGDVGDAHLALVDRGVGADVFGGLKSFLKHAVQHRAGGAAGLCGGIGFLHLAENFRFAEHLGIEPGGHFEEMAHGLAAVQTEADFFELVRSNCCRAQKASVTRAAASAIGGDAVKLDAVAGAEYRELAQAGDRGEVGPQRGGAFGAERKFFAHLEGRAPVGRPDDKESAGTHGFATRRRRRRGAGWRLASTRLSEMSAAANSTRQTQAKRFESNRAAAAAVRGRSRRRPRRRR